MAKTCEAIENFVTKAGAEIIDTVMMDGGKGLVIARYSSETAMAAAMTYNKETFGGLILAGVVGENSIASRSGDKGFLILIICPPDQYSEEKTDDPR